MAQDVCCWPLTTEKRFYFRVIPQDICALVGQDGGVNNIFSHNAIYHGHYRSTIVTYSDLCSYQEDKHAKHGKLKIK